MTHFGFDPVWLGVVIGVNLQTSFLTPPFGFALFYLRGVAPPEITTPDIYRGVVPFVALQLIGLTLVDRLPRSRQLAHPRPALSAPVQKRTGRSRWAPPPCSYRGRTYAAAIWA